ncbi:MAG TPA: signal recognition particle-docking protein FtsY [Peptococcaceae bacterium]|nr:MAG: Signal recognition particle receptor FtsY [Clostridia bacterium 41_269]HBT20022.1 signal recognition particle-docking protein FtsY [Peptococcaceae bacterium]
MPEIIGKLKNRLSKTRDALFGGLKSLVGGRKLDEELFEEIEDVLIQGDLGINTVLELMEFVRKEVKAKGINNSDEVLSLIKQKIEDILKENCEPLKLISGQLNVIMVVGVNGVGKTTSIAKLANKFKKDGKRVLLGAADTFRAAAIEQLEEWAGRLGIEVIKQQEGSDPAAVAFDALKAAQSRKADVLIIDTAGRLQTKKNLMEEIKKIKRVISREMSGAPHEVLLVLDATTGQNAISQAKLFNEALELTGIILTKLDGTAKGGIIVPIVNELGIPVKFIGVGEGIEDLYEFDPAKFSEALFDAEGGMN